MIPETRKDSLPILNVRWQEAYPSEFYDLPVLIGNMKRSQWWLENQFRNGIPSYHFKSHRESDGKLNILLIGVRIILSKLKRWKRIQICLNRCWKELVIMAKQAMNC